jgi:hypothetical protein
MICFVHEPTTLQQSEECRHTPTHARIMFCLLCMSHPHTVRAASRRCTSDPCVFYIGVHAPECRSTCVLLRRYVQLYVLVSLARNVFRTVVVITHSIGGTARGWMHGLCWSTKRCLVLLVFFNTYHIECLDTCMKC